MKSLLSILTLLGFISVAIADNNFKSVNDAFNNGYKLIDTHAVPTEFGATEVIYIFKKGRKILQCHRAGYTHCFFP